ncbi:MAG: TylF/MycF/NovP-related O-methyltransferase [Terracidiphilus sp.]
MQLVDLLKIVVFRYTRFGAPTYPFPTVEPIELATLVCEIDRLKDISGTIVEIGVARGMTTRFLAEHLVRSGYSNQDYYAIDTFRSFLKSDIDYEVQHRGKQRWDFRGQFKYNDFEIWKRNFKEFPFVKAVQSDCAIFDYSSIAPIKIAFLDVDLYLPIKRTLPRIYECVCEGGIILVDDVRNNNMYDGAYQSYMEFCDEMKITPTFVGNKCGIIRK